MTALAVRVVGDVSERSVVYLHGFLGDGRDWLPVAEALSPRSRAVLVDLPGHGGSTHVVDDRLTMDSAADGVVETLDLLGLERCALIGYSMGGRLALLLGLAHPERFTHLVLESASPGIASDSERAARRESDEAHARRLETLPFEPFLAAWYRQPLFASLGRQPPVLEAAMRRRSSNEPAALARALRGMSVGRQSPLHDRLRELCVPTLAVAGALDAKYVGIARDMATASPAVRVVVVPGAGHVVHLEQPEAFVALLDEFLATSAPALSGERTDAVHHRHHSS